MNAGTDGIRLLLPVYLATDLVLERSVNIELEIVMVSFGWPLIGSVHSAVQRNGYTIER